MHLWSFEEGRWSAVGLSGARYVLASDCSTASPDAEILRLDDVDDLQALQALQALQPSNGSMGAARAGGAASAGAACTWALLAAGSARARVNGRAFPGLHLLADRDEISLAGRELCVSMARLAHVGRFAGPEACDCPRCLSPIESGTEMVRCPRCGLRYHQSASRPCWTYVETCRACGHHTALDGALEWTPRA